MEPGDSQRHLKIEIVLLLVDRSAPWLVRADEATSITTIRLVVQRIYTYIQEGTAFSPSTICGSTAAPTLC